MKKKIIFAGIAYVVLLVAIAIGINVKSNFAAVTSSETLNGLPVYYNHAVYALDTSTPGKAYGASKYVFIAKINSILRTEYVNPTEIETGERVIIVMGAVNVMKPRVSGTLNKYILCIA